MAQLFLIAYRNLLQHTKRTLLLGGAIAGVTALLVLLLCLSSGIRSTMIESATTVMTGHINVAGFYKYSAGQSAPLVTQYKKVEEIVRKTLPDIDFIAARGRGFGRVVSDTTSLQLAIGGVDINKEPGVKRVLQIRDGKLDDLSQPNTILLFAELAKKLEVKVGDNLIISVLTPRGTNNTLDVRVAAIAEDMGVLSSFNVFVPDVSLRQLYQLNDDSVGALMIYLNDMKRVPQDLDKLRSALSAAGYQIMDREAKPFWMKFDGVNREEWTGQKIDLTSWEDELTFISWTVKSVNGLMVILTVVLLIIIAIGIMNSMWIAIRERTREIGTLRAIGMQRRRVLGMFLIEAFTLGAAGTFAGSILGLVLTGLLHWAHIHVPPMAQLFLMSSTIRFSVEFGRIFGGMAVITGCTTLISIIPSIHAARLKPITAMQHIG